MGTWLKRLSIFCLLGFPLAVLGKRLGLFDVGLAMNITAGTLLLSLIVFIVSLIVMYWQRSSNPLSSKAAGIASLLSVIPLIGIGSQIVTAKSLPMIHNISTDVVDPPEFAKIGEIRTKDHNPLEYKVDALAEVQQAAYPNVKTLITSRNKEAAHKHAIVVAEALGWKIVDYNQMTGIIEATETTGIWGFKDDIVIRVREQNGEVAVDLRSVSRVGKSDLGANAKRIEKFLAAFGN